MRSKIRVLFVTAIVIGLMVPVVAIAADRFTDVPDTNVFHDDISWLAEANITRGCNPPANDQFCPSDEVTREQMAAFLRRFASYLGAEDGIIDAYRTVAAGQAFTFTNDGKLTVAAGVTTTMVETTISAPANGYLMITNTSSITSLSSGLASSTWVQLDNTVCTGDSSFPTGAVPGTHAFSSAVDTNDENAHAGSAVAAVAAGDHTLTYCIASPAGGATEVWDANVMALWTAEGSTSLAEPAGTTLGSVNAQ
jgi:hypothetical protein